MSVGISVFRELRATDVSGLASHEETNKGICKNMTTAFTSASAFQIQHITVKLFPSQIYIFFEWISAILHKSSSAATFFHFKYTFVAVKLVRD